MMRVFAYILQKQKIIRATALKTQSRRFQILFNSQKSKQFKLSATSIHTFYKSNFILALRAL